MIHLRIVGNVVYLGGDFGEVQQVEKEIAPMMKFRPNGYERTTAYKNGEWDGWIKLYKPWDRSFPRGFLTEVMMVIGLMEIPYETTVAENEGERLLGGAFGPLTKELRPYQIEAVNKALAERRGVISLPTGCHRKGQKILMFNGTLKEVENIVQGDRLMGADSRPRVVQQVIRGRGRMVKITPVRGTPIVVNEDHILTLVRTNEHNRAKYPSDFLGGDIVDVSVRNWLRWSANKKHIHKLFHIGVRFDSVSELPIDPYFLGLLIGDGSIVEGTPGITTAQPEIVEEINKRTEEYRLKIRTSPAGKAKTYYMSRDNRKEKQNELVARLRLLGLWGKHSDDKFIPYQYKVATEEERFSLLAGLMDTDGYLDIRTRAQFDYITASPSLADDVTFLARSLGFYVGRAVCVKKDNRGTPGIYFRMLISGAVENIPTRVTYKKATERKQKKDPNRTGFSVEYVSPDEEYFGFALDGDGRYLLDDFLVTHNTGKTLVAIEIIRRLGVSAVVYVGRKELLEQWREMLAEELQVHPDFIGRVGDGDIKITQITVAMVQTVGRLPKELFNNFGISIYDEVHHEPSQTIYDITQKSKSKYLFGLSATPFRADGRDLQIKGGIGDFITRLGVSDMIKRGYLAKPTIYIYNTPPRPFSRRMKYADVYREAVTENEDRNKIITKAAEYYRGIGKSVYVHVKILAHGAELHRLIPGSFWINGGDKNEVRQAAIKNFKEHGGIMISTLLGEGCDIPNLDVLIYATPYKSPVATQQLFGRVLRMTADKKECVVIDFRDQVRFLFEHFQERLDWYRSEPAFKVVEQ